MMEASSFVWSTLSSKQQQQQTQQLAQLRQFDDQGWSPLHHAAFRGYVKSLDRFLRLDEQREANEAEQRRKETPQKTSVAVRRPTVFDSTEIIEEQPRVRLIELPTSDHVGFTPLHLAIVGGHIEVVKCLVDDHGANVNTRNSRGHGSVQLAAFGRHVEILDYLVTGSSNDDTTGDGDSREHGGDISSRSIGNGASDVWNELVALLQSDDSEEVESTAESVLGLLLLHSMSSSSDHVSTVM